MKKTAIKKINNLTALIAVSLASSSSAQVSLQGLINPGFEERRVKEASFELVETMPGWKTTDTRFEIWGTGFLGVPAHEGTQFVELNAYIDGTLYQDSTGVKPGSVLEFTFAHRGRNGDDTMKLTITDLGADNSLGGGDDTVLFTKNYTTGKKAWTVYNSTTEQKIKALGNTVRFAYGAIAATGGNLSEGNLLDAANFGIGVVSEAPPLIAPSPATIFEHINFGGKNQALVEGMNVGPLALGNDVASSVKVSPCWKVTLYGAGPGQNGPELVLTADDANLIDDNFNDIVSNVLVERDPKCSGQGNLLDAAGVGVANPTVEMVTAGDSETNEADAAEHIITRDLENQKGAIWTEQKIDFDESFKISAEIYLGTKDDNGADGLALVFQAKGNHIVSDGGGLGYQGISPSIAIEFDTYQNRGAFNDPFNDPVEDHVGLRTDGSPVHTASDYVKVGNLEDGKYHPITFEWNAGQRTFNLSLDGKQIIKERSIPESGLAGQQVYYGFTAATGGLSNEHKVRSISFSKR